MRNVIHALHTHGVEGLERQLHHPKTVAPSLDAPDRHDPASKAVACYGLLRADTQQTLRVTHLRACLLPQWWSSMPPIPSLGAALTGCVRLRSQGFWPVSLLTILMITPRYIVILGCIAALMLLLNLPDSSYAQNGGVRVLRALEFKHLDGLVRLYNGHVLFSHYDQSGNAHNAVLIDPLDGSSRLLVEGVQGAKFVAEDAKYLVYSSHGSTANPLIVRDKRSGSTVASIRLRNDIQWGHIDDDRLILVQSGLSHNTKATALVYRLPGLRFQRSTEIVGGNETVLWKDKLVSIGYRLGIYDLELREIAIVDMPPRDPSSRNVCGGGPLRIFGDKAVVGANCGQLVVVDLPSARIDRIIRMDSLFQSFDIADGLIFTVDPDGKGRDVRVIELSSGRELARIAIDTNFVAMRGNHLLGMKREGFSTPVQFTLYEIDFAHIRSETFRVAKTKQGCRAAEQLLGRSGDLHAAIEACEGSGIKGFTGVTHVTPELLDVVGLYAIWLARTNSRYNEGIELLERINVIHPEEKFAIELGRGRQKARYLDPPTKDARPTPRSEHGGVERVPFEFGTFSDLIHFDGSRTYVARWACGQTGDPGVTLDVLDRKTFRAIKRVVVAKCDNEQQDAITAIGVVPGYIVLGLEYRYPEEGRPTVVVVDAESLEVIRRGFLIESIARLRQWNGTLLACATAPGQPNHRFDPELARLVAASAEEARACVNGDAVVLRSPGAFAIDPGSVPVAETARFRVYHVSAGRETSYRLVHIESGVTSPAKVTPRPYIEVLSVPDRDALVLTFSNGSFRRFVHFDIATQNEVNLFELHPVDRPIAANVWRKFLFVSLGRDLLIYDLEYRMTVRYEKDLVREGFLNNCCGVDLNGITRLLLDNDRLVALTFDGANSRVIDLSTYLARLPADDFFITPLQ